jgi:hypothetical protein
VSVSDWQRICTVTTLADAVLPLIRTRADPFPVERVERARSADA